MFIYLNGQPDGITSGSNKSYNSSITSSIGYNRRDNDGYLTGNLDDISLFNRALSASEILDYYNYTITYPGPLKFPRRDRFPGAI